MKKFSWNVEDTKRLEKPKLNFLFRNGQPTIVPKQSGAAIGQRKGLSSNDRLKINRLYQCDGGVNPGPAPAPSPAGGSGSGSGNCVNIRTDCEFLKNAGYCTNPSVANWMIQNCKQTCGRCTSGSGKPEPPISVGGCSDANSQCASWAQFCKDPLFSNFLTSNCARTCNRC